MSRELEAQVLSSARAGDWWGTPGLALGQTAAPWGRGSREPVAALDLAPSDLVPVRGAAAEAASFPSSFQPRRQGWTSGRPALPLSFAWPLCPPTPRSLPATSLLR